MRYLLITLIILGFYLSPGRILAQAGQEKLDLPGDNLNLYATMKLFQESETLEGFEKALNDESTQINNLDLNGDDQIDYIRVFDDVQDNVHYISLKVAVSENEDQNVAVFIVQKDNNGQVQIQLIGDEDLYGKDYIIEPNSEDSVGSTPNPGYSPGRGQAAVVHNDTYAVSAWPVIRYIYVPTYRIWHSPWRWNLYPSYWNPWKPSYWHYYYGYHYNLFNSYNGYYRRVQQYRYSGWRQHYYAAGIRSTSVIVINKTKRGDYNRTYSNPGSAKQGYNTFRKNNPTVARNKNKLPSFDKTGRPVVKRANNSRSTTTRPVTKSPPRENASRPSTNPGSTESTRPARESATPSKPNTRPANTRPDVNKQSNRQPAVKQPASSGSRSRDNRRTEKTGRGEKNPR